MSGREGILGIAPSSIAVIFAFLPAARSQVVEEWVRTYDGPQVLNRDDSGRAIALDGLGNVFVAGTTYMKDGDSDFLTMKFSASDSFEYETALARYDGPGNSLDAATAMAVDPFGDVIVTGQSVGAGTGDDFATVKYDNSLNEVWVRRYDGPGGGADRAVALAVDASGFTYVTGESLGSGTDNDFATIKYDVDGTPLWTARYNRAGNSNDVPVAVAVDGLGNVYVTGTSAGPGGNTDYSTVKYDSGGNQVWARKYDGVASGVDEAKAMFIGPDGSIYVTGASTGIGTGLDYLTVKYDPDGNLLWYSPYSGVGGTGDDVPAAIAPAPGDRFYVTGSSAAFDSVLEVATTFFDDSDGSYRGEERERGAGGGPNIPHALVVDPSGTVYVASTSQGAGNGTNFSVSKCCAFFAYYWYLEEDGLGSSSDEALALAVDGDGNVYATGASTGMGTGLDAVTEKFGPDGISMAYNRFYGYRYGSDQIAAAAVDPQGNVYVTGLSDGEGTQWDIATIKYRPDGSREWVSRYTTPGENNNWANAMALDGSGNILLAGFSDDNYSTIKLGPGGNFLWAAKYAGGSTGVAQKVAVDPDGNVYVTGYSYGIGTDRDFATLKYDAGGHELWARRHDGPDGLTDTANAIALDGDRNVHVTGFSRGASTGYDCVTIKYDAAGNQLWSRRYSGPGTDDVGANAIALDSKGNVYVTGGVSGYFITKDFLTIKYDPAGNEEWAALYDGPADGLDGAIAVAVDRDDQVYVAGQSMGGSTGWDIATVKYDSNGNRLWVARGRDTGAFDIATALALDPSGKVCVTGLDSIGGLSTALYDSDGEELWFARYRPAGFDWTRSSALVADPEVNFYVAGGENTVAPNSLSLVIKYSVPTLELGVPASFALTPDQPKRYFKLSVPEGEPVLITLQDADASDENALYLRWGDYPRRYRFDDAANSRGRPSRRLVVPYFQDRAAYLLVEADRIGGGSNDVTLLATSARPALESFSGVRSSAGGSGALSAAATGAGFLPGTAFALVHRATRQELPASGKVVVSSSRAELEFPLAGAPAGSYDLKAVQSGAPPAVLEGAFQVETTREGARLSVGLGVPAQYRHGRPSTISLRFSNEGDEEMAAPLLRVVGSSRTKFRLLSEGEFEGSSIQVLGVDPAGLPGRLSPGAAGEIPIAFVSTEDVRADFAVEILAPQENDVVGWETLAPPQGMVPGDWGSLWPRLSASLGATWIDYREGLASLATRLARRGVDPSSVRELFRFAVREAYGRPGGAVAGTVRDGGTFAPLPGEVVLALKGGVVRSSAVTGPSGSYSLDWLEEGATYDLRVSGRSASPASAAVPAGGDALGVDLLLGAAGSAYGPACPGCDETGLPGAPPLPPDRVFTTVHSASTVVLSSFDPNEKDGPAGDGLDVEPDQELLYTIYFENLKTATAWAREVVVEDQLVPQLDWTTFRLRDVHVGQDRLFTFDTRGAESAPAATFSLEDGYGGSTVFQGLQGQWLLDISCAYDPKTGKARWVFRTLDPATGQPPDLELYPAAGFLPPDDPLDQDLRGEGHVSFSVSALPDAADGTEITNQASIVFDDRAPMETEVWRNRVSRSIPPELPLNPFPRDGTDHPVDIDAGLSWQSKAEEFDVFLGVEGTTPVLVASRLITPDYRPPQLFQYGKTYRWRVTARSGGGSKDGPPWTFKTVDPPAPPAKPTGPQPPTGATGVPRRPVLRWSQAAGAAYYEVYLWPHGGSRPNSLLGTPVKSELPVPEDLDPLRQYDWQVVAVKRSIQGLLPTEGDPWTFTTAAGSTPYRRGDMNSDGAIDISDPVFGLGFLFLGGTAPSCMKTLDTNDDGEKDISDAVFLLAHLFLGGPAPIEPFKACGGDPTSDGLDCAAHPPCNP